MARTDADGDFETNCSGVESNEYPLNLQFRYGIASCPWQSGDTIEAGDKRDINASIPEEALRRLQPDCY